MLKKIIIFISITPLMLSAAINCEKEYCGVSKNMTFWGFNLYHFDYKIDKEGNQSIYLTYKREIEKEKNVDKTIEKFAQNNPNSEEFASLLKEWNSHLIDVKEGTIYEVHVNKNGAKLIIDNQELFKTPSKEFGEMYLKIWSGKKPVDEELQKEITIAKNKIKLQKIEAK